MFIEKDVVVIIPNVFRLNKVGSGQALASFKLRIAHRIRHGLRKIDIVREHDGERLPERHRADRHRVGLTGLVHSFQQAEPDIQRWIESIVKTGREPIGTVIIAFQQQGTEIDADGIGMPPVIVLCCHSHRPVRITAERSPGLPIAVGPDGIFLLAV